MLEVIERDRLFDAAARAGERLRAGLVALAGRQPRLVGNARGLGLLCAVDLADRATRDEALRRLRADEHVLALPAGERTVRLRPALTITDEEIDAALAAFGRVVAALAPPARRPATIVSDRPRPPAGA